MKLRNLKFLVLPATLTLNLVLCGSTAAGAVIAPPDGPGAPEHIISGSQITQVEGFDWGPGVTQTIVSLDQAVTADSVRAARFTVSESKQTYDYAAYGQFSKEAPYTRTDGASLRTVTDVYTCDENGSPLEGSSSHIALELKCTPDEGSCFYYSLGTSQNNWCGYYNLDIALEDGCTLTAEDGTLISQLAVNPSVDWSQSLMPDLAGIDLTGTFTAANGDKMTYASYIPANASESHKRPLVIWLHGAGEGGTDPRIVLFGNKVTALMKPEFQNTMGGAYVLAPQVPDFWMTYDENGSWADNPGTDSVHLTGLNELIRTYVAANPGIDTDRIIIGGCSNGGYMTMNMILNYPDYFAAAYPICEAYRDSAITDEQLESIKNLPVWFVYANNDGTVAPGAHAASTVLRLKAMNANMRASIFPDVHDTTGLYTSEDGSPYEYNGHWSWTYFFNNQCRNNRLTMWSWMAQRSR